MAITPVENLKQRFKKGMYPTEDDFANVFDSYVHKSDGIDIGNVSSENGTKTLTETLQDLKDTAVQEAAAAAGSEMDERLTGYATAASVTALGGRVSALEGAETIVKETFYEYRHGEKKPGTLYVITSPYILDGKVATRVFLGDVLVHKYEPERAGTLSATKFHNLCPSATTESVIFMQGEAPAETFRGWADNDSKIGVYSDDNKNFKIVANGAIYAPANVGPLFRSYIKLNTLILDNLNTSEVVMPTDPGYSSGLFGSCKQLEFLDLSYFDISSMTSLRDMFLCCEKLRQLDIQDFRTSNITDMAGMFYYCSSVTEIDLSKFDTSNVTDMSCMLGGMGVSTLDVSNFDTSKVENFINMFLGLTEVKELNLENFTSEALEKMDSMFYGCPKLENVNMPNLIADNVEDFRWLFEDCISLKSVNLKSLNPESATAIDDAFNNCPALERIYCNADISALSATSTGMFTGCTSLVGGNGTAYDATKTDKTYARVDAAGAPGYFTPAS